MMHVVNPVPALQLLRCHARASSIQYSDRLLQIQTAVFYRTSLSHPCTKGSIQATRSHGVGH